MMCKSCGSKILRMEINHNSVKKFLQNMLKLHISHNHHSFLLQPLAMDRRRSMCMGEWWWRVVVFLVMYHGKKLKQYSSNDDALNFKAVCARG